MARIRTRRGDSGPRRRTFATNVTAKQEFPSMAHGYYESGPQPDLLESVNAILRTVENEIGTPRNAEIGEIEFEVEQRDGSMDYTADDVEAVLKAKTGGYPHGILSSIGWTVTLQGEAGREGSGLYTLSGTSNLYANMKWKGGKWKAGAELTEDETY